MAGTLVAVGCTIPDPEAARRDRPVYSPGQARSLAEFVTDPDPWLPFEPNSDQRQPVYIGAKPRELVANQWGTETASLPDSLRQLGEAQLQALAKAMGWNGTIEIEAWPAEDDYGWQITWAFARWRGQGAERWRWLDAGLLKPEDHPDPELHALLPRKLLATQAEDRRALYADFLELGLYDRPVFSECVWTDPTGDEILDAWLPPDQRETHATTTAEDPKARPICHAIRQPARLDGKPRSWIVTLAPEGVQWPKDLLWTTDPLPQVQPRPSTPRIADWPADLTEALRQDVKICTGEEEAVFPKSGRRLRFTRKNSAQQDHQLEKLAQYLRERYEVLGLRTRWQEFTWRGIRQVNLVAILPGRSVEGGPWAMADHYDTAFADAHFRERGQRVSVPGADDNCSATAVLLRTAEILKDRPRAHELWLVHLTGEEYPGDDLGARYWVSDLLREKHPFRGLLLLDMIAFHPGPTRGGIVQINAGDSPQSLEMAAVALGAAGDAAPQLQAQFRSRFDRRSYLYNTDGHIFSQAGYPVVLLNEHLNGVENLDRPHYHENTDTTQTLNWDYFTAVARLAIETAARLTEPEPKSP